MTKSLIEVTEFGDECRSSIRSNDVFPNGRRNKEWISQKKFTREQERKQRRQFRNSLRAESYAQQLLRTMIGFDGWRVYRRTNRVVVHGKKDWLMGDLFGNYNRFYPLVGKPDVVRIDGRRRLGKGWQTTSFCVVSQSRDDLPYTDKELAFAVYCLNDEDEFYKLANRIGEGIFNQLPECAVFNGR